LVAVLAKVGAKRVQRWKAPAQAPEKWDIADPLPDSCDPEPVVRSILEAPETTAARIVRTLAEFLADYVAPDYLVEGLLQHHYFYSLTGMTGAGKTAVALLIAILVADRAGGQNVGTYAVEHGRVVYIARENPTDVRMRLIGMCEKMGIDPAKLDLFVIEQLETLDKDLPRITREIEALGDVALVIVDTSVAVFQGDNENDTVQQRDHAKRQRKLCDLPGRPCVVTLCHPIKNASSPEQLVPRGAGAFLNEVDGNFSLWAHDDRLADLHWTGKFRGPDFEKVTFRLTPINTMRLVDKKGRLLPTVMAQLVTLEEVAEAEAKGLFQEDHLLVAMLKRPRGSLAELAIDCGWLLRHPDRPNKELARRVMARLKKEGLAKKDG